MLSALSVYFIQPFTSSHSLSPLHTIVTELSSSIWNNKLVYLEIVSLFDCPPKNNVYIYCIIVTPILRKETSGEFKKDVFD